MWNLKSYQRNHKVRKEWVQMDIYMNLDFSCQIWEIGEHGFPRKGNWDGDRVFTENLFFVSFYFCIMFMYYLLKT